MDLVPEPSIIRPPPELYQKLKLLPQSAYAKMPDEMMSTQSSDQTYGIVNYKRLAEQTLRKKFYALLFGPTIATHIDMEQWRNDPALSIVSCLYAANDSEGCDGGENFIENTFGNPNRVMSDLIVGKMLTASDVSEILVCLLNVRKILNPGHPLINQILLHGLSIINYCQAILTHNEIPSIIIAQDGDIKIDIDASTVTDKNIFSRITMIRGLPFVHKSCVENSIGKKPVVICDTNDNEWDLEALNMFLSKEVACIHRITKDNWCIKGNKLTKELPQFELAFKAVIRYTAEGFAVCDPREFGLKNSAENPFMGLPPTIIILKEWTLGEIEIAPMTFYCNGQLMLLFAHVDEAYRLSREYNEMNHYPGECCFLKMLVSKGQNTGFIYPDAFIPDQIIQK